jgi:hypothetical protein
MDMGIAAMVLMTANVAAAAFEPNEEEMLSL